MKFFSFRKRRDFIPNPVEKGIKKTENFLDDFKKFAVKGNVTDLAIGIVIGAAFTSVINSLVDDVITPLIDLIIGNINIEEAFIDLSGMNYKTFEEATEAGANILRYGLFIEAVAKFLIVALILFIIVKYFIKKKKEVDKKEEESMKECKFCFEKIKDEAIKCKFCASKQ